MRASAEDRQGEAPGHVGRGVRQGRLARRRPRLRRSIERFPASDGTLYLLGHGDALALPDLPDHMRALLAGLDGSRTLDGLAELRSARVVVIGLGGLGAWALWALAAAGVGRLVGIDGDVVERSNLNRQTLYREQDLGTPKAVAAGRTIAAFNSGISFEPVPRRLESEAEVAAAVAGADFVIEAADWPPYRLSRWINSACADALVPHVGASQFPPLVRVGPTFVPGRRGCLACLEESARARDPLFDELAAWRQRADTFAATFAPACSLIGGVLSSDVIHHITGLAEPATLGASLVIDMRTLEQRRVPVVPVPGCPVCSA